LLALRTIGFRPGFQAHSRGCPKWLGDGSYIALNNKAPHPNGGKLFIDYFLNDESMKANLGEFVNREGIYPPLPDAGKI
jgi:hypothetical protein